jgi:hypothetical protein
LFLIDAIVVALLGAGIAAHCCGGARHRRRLASLDLVSGHDVGRCAIAFPRAE